MGSVASVGSVAQGQVGSAACAKCHTSIHQRWSGARHSKMLQPATAATVAGRFSDGTVELRGTKFSLSITNGAYFVRGPFPGTREETHKVEFTLGSRRVQHYIARLADGRLVVLPPSWDVERRTWFHNLEIVSPDAQAVHPIQVWNSQCFGCHVSGATKGFDLSRGTYDTKWIDFGTGCERCHGPGEAHVNRMSASSSPSDLGIISPARLSPERSTMVCAQCHSMRDITVADFTAGSDYFDHFTPVLEYAQPSSADPAYWADGRPRRFSNDAIGFWQSRCYLQGGATCTTCHTDAHVPNVDRNPQLSKESNTTCTKCHAAVAEAGTRHTHHAAGSEGSACAACHMPRTVISLRSRMPDHTISVPAPENTVRHDIPNACNECHQSRDAAWASQLLAEWFPGGRRQRLVARADAFSAARRQDASAVEGLIKIATDEGHPPLARANALGHLRRFPGPRSETYLSAGLSSDHAAIRLTAALGLGEAGFTSGGIVPVLVNALGDSAKVVRIGAALSLMNQRVTSLEGPSGVLFEEAKRDYVLRATLLSDDARVLFDVGKFHLMNQDSVSAVRTLTASLSLDPALHAGRYFLGLALLASGRTAEARAQLSRIPKDDAYSAAAQKVLAGIKGG
ncbi:MAG TPA: cytochrome c3 family protein [Vicinamibacterales bacterium]|nr:cytochrome c3 family protein [Vicinamibacterales bacterium]